MRIRTFLDVDRLVSETDRRLHAADLERARGVVQVVPSAAFKLAPRVTPNAWGRSEQHLRVLADETLEDNNRNAWIQVQRERWWNHQWRKTDGLYRVCTLSREQREIAEQLTSLQGFDPQCFPKANTPLAEHNDAVMLAEIAALGGTMLITSETEMVDEAALAQWMKNNRDRFSLPTTQLVYNADELFMHWAKHPDSEVPFIKSAIGAFWPEQAGCSLNEARDSIASGVRTLKENKMPRFGRYLEHRFERRRDITQIMKAVQQRGLPYRMREAEHEYRVYLGLHTERIHKPRIDRGERVMRPTGYEW